LRKNIKNLEGVIGVHTTIERATISGSIAALKFLIATMHPNWKHYP